MLRDTLSSAGFHVFGEASTAAEAIDLFGKARLYVVLMDITMSRMDGLDVLRAIRATNPNACVTIYTALGHERLISEAIGAGTRNFIAKPFTPKRVVASVKTVLNMG